jgi:hypothetical protein
MNSQDFRKLVADMRHAQKEYFRTRSNTKQQLQGIVDRKAGA